MMPNGPGHSNIGQNGSGQSSLGLVPVQQEAAPLRRKIGATLRQAIENGTLKAGERLLEKDLCREMNVSRTSLREAIRELEAEGLLATSAGGGVCVAQITPEEAGNIYRIRGALEALVVEQFAERADAVAMQALRRSGRAIARAYQSGRIDQILAAKRELYQMLCRGAGNLTVLDMLVRLNARINQLRTRSLSAPNRFAASNAEIQTLIAALQARDIVAARQAALYHIAQAALAALGAKLQIGPVADESGNGRVARSGAKRIAANRQDAGKGDRNGAEQE